MSSREEMNPESEDFEQGRPSFYIGQHDSTRKETLTDAQQDQVLDSGVSCLL